MATACATLWLARLHEQFGRAGADQARPSEAGGEAAGRDRAARDEREARATAATAPAPTADEPLGGDGAPAEASPGDDTPRAGDETRARLTALNMALSGTPREETARSLAEHFSPVDSDALLDVLEPWAEARTRGLRCVRLVRWIRRDFDKSVRVPATWRES